MVMVVLPSVDLHIVSIERLKGDIEERTNGIWGRPFGQGDGIVIAFGIIVVSWGRTVWHCNIIVRIIFSFYQQELSEVGLVDSPEAPPSSCSASLSTSPGNNAITVFDEDVSYIRDIWTHLALDTVLREEACRMDS